MITNFKLFENKLWYKTIPEFLSHIESLKIGAWIFLDTETTGLGGPKKQQLTQIAAISTNPSDFTIIDKYNKKIKLTDDIKKQLDKPAIPGGWTRKRTLSFNRYGDKVGKYVEEQDVLTDFFDWVNGFGKPSLVIQNAEFDMKMLSGRFNSKFNKYPIIDTKQIIQLYLIPLYHKLAETDNTYKEKLNKIGTSSRDFGLTSSSMSKWAPEFDIDTSGYHDALFDCEMTIKMYQKMIELLTKHSDLDISKYQNERIKKNRKK